MPYPKNIMLGFEALYRFFVGLIEQDEGWWKPWAETVPKWGKLFSSRNRWSVASDWLRTGRGSQIGSDAMKRGWQDLHGYWPHGEGRPPNHGSEIYRIDFAQVTLISSHFLTFHPFPIWTRLTEACLDARRPPPPKAPRMSDAETRPKKAETRKRGNPEISVSPNWHQWGQRKTPGKTTKSACDNSIDFAPTTNSVEFCGFLFGSRYWAVQCALRGSIVKQKHGISMLLHVMQLLDDGSNVEFKVAETLKWQCCSRSLLIF